MPNAPVNTGDIIQAATITGLVNGSIWHSADSGTASAYKVVFDGTGTNSNRITSLTNGQIITFIAGASNTVNGGASTLQVQGATLLPAAPLTKSGGAQLLKGDIAAGQLVAAVYVASPGRFELLTTTIRAHAVKGQLAADVTLVTGNYSSDLNWTVTSTGNEASPFDTDGFFSSGTPNRLTIPVGLSGRYQIIFKAQFAGNGNGSRYSLVAVNGIQRELQASPVPSALGDTYLIINSVMTLTAGQLVQAKCYQDSGGPLTLRAAETFLTLIWLGA